MLLLFRELAALKGEVTGEGEVEEGVGGLVVEEGIGIALGGDGKRGER